MEKFSLENIVSWAKRKGFVYPGSIIYWGLANSWDYGPYWSILKKNIADAWRKFFVQQRDDMIGMDTAIIAHPRTWEASGHVWAFNDPMVDDKKTGQRFRADKLIEDSIEKMRKKLSDYQILADIETTTGLSWENKITNLIPEAWGLDRMHKYITSYKLKNPDSWAEADWTEVRKFNLMLYTFLWPVHDDKNKAYLRPETCQSLFTNFKNILDSTRNRVPFWLAQIWKSFRNEITPGQFLYRTREFEQMEIEYFVEADPEKAKQAHEDWKQYSMDYWKNIIAIKPENLRFREHESDELSHYSAWTFDVEYKYPWGWWELQWLANRTDYDLKQHQQFSGVDMRYTDPKTWARYIPWVIEPSFGLTRTVMAVMLDCYDEETLTTKSWETDKRVVIRFPKNLAPIKFAVLPLMEKDENMSALARKIFKKLTENYMCEYDWAWNIWKRYRRQDEIWTPYCITVDHQSLEDWTVTVRDRDSMEQTRVNWEEIKL